MQICTSLQTDNRAMTTPHQSVFTGRMPFLPPNQQRQSTEGKSVGRRPRVDWLIDLYGTLLQSKGWIAKYNMYTKIENTIKYNTKKTCIMWLYAYTEINVITIKEENRVGLVGKIVIGAFNGLIYYPVGLDNQSWQCKQRWYLLNRNIQLHY